MSSSLRDQLVKAGLATAGAAKKAEREQQQAQRRAKGAAAKGAKSGKGGKGGAKGKPGSAPPDTSPEAIAKARARQIQLEKVERDRAIARVRNEKSAQKAKRAEIKQLIAQNDVRASAAKDDDLPYNFVHGKKIKKIYLPKQQIEDLSAGRLVIVNNDGRYHIVGKAVAKQISQRDPKWIIAAHDQAKGNEPEQDEYYKQFEVPDDLDW